MTLDAAIRRHVRLVLDRVEGDREAAAELLDVDEEELDGYLAD
jgi:hypothetical protein